MPPSAKNATCQDQTLTISNLRQIRAPACNLALPGTMELSEALQSVIRAVNATQCARDATVQLKPTVWLVGILTDSVSNSVFHTASTRTTHSQWRPMNMNASRASQDAKSAQAKTPIPATNATKLAVSATANSETNAINAQNLTGCTWFSQTILCF